MPGLAENERVQSLHLRPFDKCLKGKINFSQMAWKQACTNLIWEHIKRNQMLVWLSYGPGQNIISIKFKEIVQNFRKTGERKACFCAPFIKVCLGR